MKLTPDDAWLQPVHVDLGPMRTYGDVLYTALPRALEAVRECNQDKAAIKTWKTDRSAHN